MINFMDTIKYHMERPDIYLIFEGTYKADDHTQSIRHQLSLHTSLPTHNVALKVVHNKVQLISSICHYLINPNPSPVQVWNNCSLQREDLKTNHEESDVIIVHHLFRIASEASGDSYFKVVCSDIDHVFVQLIRFYLEKNMTMNVSMESP